MSEQTLLVLQSMWAMERRHTDGVERSVDENIDMIATAGFGGVSAPWSDRAAVATLSGLLKSCGLVAEGQCFPKNVDDLQPVLALAAQFPVHHIVVQADVRPRTIAESLPLLEGWLRLAEQADVPIYFETHRNRITSDLFFTLDLLDRLPELPLLADLSHIVVAREFEAPVTDENHALIERVLNASWAFHGRVATSEQVQIEISFPAHRPWVEQFARWWSYGFASWRRRSTPGSSLSFTCELGPKPYAIVGRDGNDTTDRWQESLALADLARDLWARTA